MSNTKESYFSKREIILWCVSVLFIVVSFCVFDGEGWLTLAASVIGATSLIFNAKGNPAGQLLMVVFSVLYGVISYKVAYYGEMATYLGMTAPMAVFSFFSWLKNPYDAKRAEVKVNRLKSGEIWFMLVLTAAVTVMFYFILNALGNANIVPGTISVTTSFLAVYLTFRRSAHYAIAYAANDIVLIILWAMAAREDISYLSVLICFIVFFVNDIYGFIMWSKMQQRQSGASRNMATDTPGD